MNIKGILIAACLVGFTFCSFAQNEQNIWYFGDQLGITFNTTPPSVLEGNDKSAMQAIEGCAVQADETGNLLFYTNGEIIWNKDHEVMETGLLGHPDAVQSSIIVPNPEHSNLYYVFSLDAKENSYQEGLNYSIVDMSNGTGEVKPEEKNIKLLPDTLMTEKLIAVRHGNGKDVWVITHQLDTDAFILHLVTGDSVTFVGMQQVGSVYEEGVDGSYQGYLKASLQGDKLAAIAGYNPDGYVLEIYDFNNCTGEISNPVSLLDFLPFGDGWYGLTFSPDGTKLYYSGSQDGGINQIDITSGEAQSIKDTKEVITVLSYGALQLGPDQKIYGIREVAPHLGIINNPNLTGEAVDFVDQGIDLGQTPAALGLPNFMVDVPERLPEFTLGNDTLLCHGNTVILQPDPQYDYVWQDGSDNKTFEVSEAGTYWAEASNECGTFVDSIRVSYVPLIEFGDASIALTCDDENAILEADTEGIISYQWLHDGSTGSSVTVSQSGIYTVEATDSCGVVYQGSIDVDISECELMIPNVITPNGDDKNDSFTVRNIGDGWDIEIYNRWGKRVFESDNYTNNWKGEDVSAGIYYYILFDPENGQTYKGWLQVLK